MPYLLPLLDRPLLQAQMTVFWIIMLATLARLAADAYNLVLFALKRDRAFALTGVGGTIGSVLTNLTLIPLMGLMGAALAYLVTNAGVVSARVLASRQGGQKVRRLAVSH
jgi:O-antigen/teichoic acid export membrane protein